MNHWGRILNKTFVKRRYFETRAGITVMSPAISASTLIGVAFLYIQDIIPIWIFIPTFVIFMITVANSNSREFLERMDYVKKISEGK